MQLTVVFGFHWKSPGYNCQEQQAECGVHSNELRCIPGWGLPRGCACFKTRSHRWQVGLSGGAIIDKAHPCRSPRFHSTHAQYLLKGGRPIPWYHSSPRRTFPQFDGIEGRGLSPRCRELQREFSLPRYEHIK
jgi:hypothetical protein